MSSEIKAEIEQLINYKDFLNRNMDHNVSLFEDFLRGTNGLEWDDPILENVTRVLNEIVKHLNDIRAEIGYANEALQKMIDILEEYSRIRVNQ